MDFGINHNRNNIYWIIIGSFSIGIGLFLVATGTTIDINLIPLIFSSISTSLSAIFALVFAILTISVQMSKRYDAMDLFYTSGTMVLMLMFSVTIILPLLMLQIGYYFPILIITLFTFCVLSLFPFLRNISSTIKFEVGLQNLKTEISEAIDLNYDASAANKTRDLGHLGFNAIKENKNDVLDIVIKFFSDISLRLAIEIESIQEHNEKNPGVFRLFELQKCYDTLGEELLKLISIASEKSQHKKILKESLQLYSFHVGSNKNNNEIEKEQKLLKNVGIKFIEHNLSDELIANIQMIFFHTLENDSNFGSIRKKSISYLSELGRKSFEKNLKNSLYKSVFYIWYSGANTMVNYLELNKKCHNRKLLPDMERILDKKKGHSYEILIFAIEELHIIRKMIGEREFEKTYNIAINYKKLPGLLKPLAEFKSLFDEHIKK